MCLAIYQPCGISIPESHLSEGFKNNPHGAGFMFFDENGVLQTRRFMGYADFIEEYERCWAMHGQYSPFAVHFRWATHGTTNIDNVHPFRMNENVAVLHNGIIDCLIADKAMSDTAAFVRDYLGALPRNFQDNPYLFEMVEQYAAGSKLVLMTNDPDAQYSAYIFNEQLGHWTDKAWYSNASYSCAKPRGFIKSASESAAVFEDEDGYVPAACELCGEESVLDMVCYSCESCQECWMTEEECKCDASLAVHGMTDADFHKYYATGWSS